MRKSAPFYFFALAFLVVLGLYAESAHAQLKISDRGRHVTAIIDPNNQGLITIRKWPGTNLDPILSYPQKSFASIMVGDKIFTNNHTGGNISGDPRFGGFLDNGVTQQIADTLRTTWPNKNGCDIIQEVYGVQLEASGQIVIRWKVKNNSPNTPVWGQVQFLLDLQVGAQNPNDGAPVLTRYGYRPIWEYYTDASTYKIPWFFSAFEQQLPNPPTFSTGITGVGYNQDVNYTLGLKKPAQMTVGDWGSPLGTAALVDFLWGVSSAAPWGTNYTDAAILYQWEGVGIGGGKTAEIARTSYGTGEFGICTGQLFGIVFYPRYFRWQGSKYQPDTARVEFYAFDVYSPIPQDPNYGPPSANTYLTMNVGPNLQILSPLTDPPNNSKTQRQLMGPAAGYIPQYGVGTAFWNIKADKATNCLNTMDSWLKFTAQSSLSGTGPIFFNSGDGDTCEHHLKIDCVEEDFIAPYVNNETEIKVFPFEKSFKVHDNRTKDKGIDKVSWVATPGSGTYVSNFDITVSPALTPCTKEILTYTVRQKDSTKGGCFDFTFVDCVGNDTSHTVCLAARPLIPTPDTLNPVISTVEHTPGYPGAAPCNGRCDSLLFTDNQQYDVGLESIAAIGLPVNMKLDVLYVPFTAKSHRGKICVVDSMLDGSITIRVQDTVGNYTDSTYIYCTVPDTTCPEIRIVDDPVRRGHWTVFVSEINPWDRLIDSIFVVNPINVIVNPPLGVPPSARNSPLSSFEVFIADSTKDASFCIEAKDLRGGTMNCPRVCANATADPDVLSPSFIATPPTGTRTTIVVHDYHTNAGGDTLGWDKGVDSIWYTGRRGILAPQLPMKVNCQMVAPVFTLTVEDTLDIDSIACITIHALDCANNINSFQWCYPYSPDDLPPILRVGYTSRTQLIAYVADSQLYDRGLKSLTLSGEDNYTPLKLDVNAVATIPSTVITRPNYSKSSFGTLEAIDYWGTLNVSQAEREAHTARVDLGVWVQDLQMRKGQLVETSGQFELPIWFVENDTFSLDRKGIDEFEFTFTLSGDVGAVNLVGVRQVGSATETWTIDPPQQTGNTYRIHGRKTGAQSLTKVAGDELIALVFDAVKTEFNKEVILTIDQPNGETILYNNGTDRLVSSKNAVATLPAPYGTLSGSHIVIVGTCSPTLETGAPPPSIVTLDQNSPNPFTGKTTFSFTVKTDGLVRLGIYDMLGKEIESVVSSILPQGRYTVTVDGSKYGSGAYIARLQANGTVRSRTIHIER